MKSIITNKTTKILKLNDKSNTGFGLRYNRNLSHGTRKKRWYKTSYSYSKKKKKIAPQKKRGHHFKEDNK